MKILWFINIPAGLEDYYKITNASGFWLKALSHCLKDKVELHIAFYYTKNNGDFKHNGIYYHPLKFKKYYKIALKNKFNIFNVDEDDIDNYMNLIDLVKPDLIHIHGSENSFTCLIGKTQIPIVLSIQGIMTTVARRMYQSIEEKYWNKNEVYINTIFDFLTFGLLKIGQKNYEKAAIREQKNLISCKYIIGRTDWDRFTAKILAPNAIYYHNDEIIRSIFFKQQWNFPSFNKTFTIFSICSSAPYKGFELICESLSLLNQNNVDLEWTVAGISENSPVVRAVKRKLGINYPKKKLNLIGYQDENGLLEAMLSSKIYVMPSHIENGCNALSEAMLLGMPCITSLSGGTGTTVRHNIDGVIIQGGDPFALSGAILELSENKKFSIYLGSNAREISLKRHNQNTIVNDLLDIYKKIKIKEN